MKCLDSSHMRQMNRGWLVWEGILLWMATRRLLSILSIAHNFELPGNHITAVFRYRVQRSTYAAYITPNFYATSLSVYNQVRFFLTGYVSSISQVIR